MIIRKRVSAATIIGVFVALTYTVIMLNTSVDIECFMPRRCQYLQMALGNFEEGIHTAWRFDGHISKFVYWYLIARILHIRDAYMAMYMAYILVWDMAIICVPSILCKNGDDNHMIVIRMVCIYICMSPFLFTISDDKHIYAWVVWMCIPLLWSIFRTDDHYVRRRLISICWLWVGMASAMRICAEAPIFVPLVVVTIKEIYDEWKDGRRIHIFWVISCVLLYYLWTSIGLYIVRISYNYLEDGHIGNWLSNTSLSESPWHQLFIGLFVESDNPFGMVYTDQTAYDFSLKWTDLRDVWIRLLKSNTVYCVGLYLRKLFKSVIYSFFSIRYILFCFVLCVIISMRKHYYTMLPKLFNSDSTQRNRNLCCLLVYFVGLLPGCIDIPDIYKTLGAAAVISFCICQLCVKEISRWYYGERVV